MKYVWRIFPYLCVDYKAAQAWLEKQGAEGLRLAGVSCRYLARFTREEGPVHYFVDLAADGGADYLQLCADAGWERVAQVQGMDLFVSRPGEDPVPIQSDPIMEERRFGRKFVRSNLLGILGALAFLALVVAVMAAMAAEGKLLLEGVKPGHLREVLRVLGRAGASISTGEEFIALEMNGRPAPLWVETRPYPGFPTDLQSPLMALLCRGEGVSRIRETVFERRYETAGELNKLGASIRVRGDTALIDGKPRLKGGRAAARDLRGGAALVVAGLESPAETVISDCFHIERGYEDICRDLAAAGADIRWLEREAKEKRA